MPKRRIIVNVSDAKVSKNLVDILATYSLGSYISVCLYDPAVHLSGMLHYQLPNSSMDPERARDKPFMFADTDMEILIHKLLAMGANKKRMQIKIAGGSTMDTGPKGFDIDKRNYLPIRKILWKNGMFIDPEDVGGSSPRTLYMNKANGAVTVKSNGLEKNL